MVTMKINLLGLFAVSLTFISLFLPWLSVMIFIEKTSGYIISHRDTSPIRMYNRLWRGKSNSHTWDFSNTVIWINWGNLSDDS
jgi:hypothetical protein